MATALISARARRICAGSLLVFTSLLAIHFPLKDFSGVWQAAGWSQPAALSPNTQSAWFPDIAADAAGRVHVAWASTLSSGVGQAYDVVMYASAQSGAPWPPAQDIIALPSKGASTRPTLLVDNQGLLHLTYRSYTVFYSHAPVQSVAATALLPPRPISSVDNGYFSRLAMDQQGRLHLVYTENIQSPSCTGCFHVFYRQSVDQGLNWSPAVDISRLPAGAAKPQLIIDATGYLHVVWEAGLGGDLGQLSVDIPTQVMVTSSYDGGQSWSTPIALAALQNAAPVPAALTATPALTATKVSPTALSATATPNATAVPHSFKNITLSEDGQKALVAAFLVLPEDRLYYQVSRDQGRSWSDALPIPGGWGAWTVYQGRTDDYAMVTDSAGIVHLIFVGRTAESDSALSLLHMTWDGMNWGQPEPIATFTGDVPEWPRAAVGLGNDLHVVWFVRDQAHIFGGEGASLYRIWYAHKRLPAPALTAAVWPTLGPSLSPSATSASPASPSPAPGTNLRPTSISTPGAAVNTELVYNEMDYLKVVALGLIPAVAVILLVVAAVLVSRR